MGEDKRDRLDPPFFLKPVVNAISGRRVVQVYMKLASPLDRFLIPATGGWVSTAPGQQLAVIETVGARSGKKRRTPLLYMRDGGNVVLVASYGGSKRHPAWYWNLKANPRVRLWARKARGWYTARVVEGEERERLWREVMRFYPGYAKYQTYTDREIQIFVLTPES
jgi:deazaflavin-dependent oxidoreductase (nitroreductase family)